MEPPTEHDRIRWLLTLAVIGCAVCASVLWWYRSAPPDPAVLLRDDHGAEVSSQSLPAEADPASSEIGVDVIGAVQRPGLYYFEPGARIADAVAAAGGYAPDADREAINEAVRLKDEQQLRVPQVVARSEASVVPTVASAGLVSSPATADQAVLLDLNTADANALETLPGIGPVMAERIVTYRASQGTFGSIEQLQDVPGIGPATFTTLRQYLTVLP